MIRPLLHSAAAALVLAACSHEPAARAPLPSPPPTAPCVAPAPVAAAAPTPTDEGRPISIGRSYTLPSNVLNATRRINVYLPDGYADASRSFPVLYLLDGGEHEDFHHITGVVALEALGKHTREMIVVGIEQPDRRHDLTYPSSDPKDKEAAPTSGGSADFRRFLATELQPYVRAHYRTTDERAIIGESLAGLFIVETFLRQPELFDGYIAISPSLWWDHGSLAKEAAARVSAFPPGRRAIYITVGNEGRGMLDGALGVVGALKSRPSRDVTWHYDPLPNETHDTIYEPAAQHALRAIFPAPAPAH